MAFGAEGNTIFLILGEGAVFLLGLFFPEILVWVFESESTESESTETNESADPRQVSINQAILYATLTLVLSSVVSQWPPEGQETLPYLADVVFFGTAIIAAFIFGRVIRLICELELMSIHRQSGES